MKSIILVLSLIAATLFSAKAGPVPYTSVRIYFLGDWNQDTTITPKELRKRASVVISLKDEEALAFFDSLDFHNKMKIDKKIASRSKPLIMVIDLFWRTEPPFEGHHDSLLCSDSYAYVDSGEGRYIDSKPILQRITTLITGKKADQGSAAGLWQSGR